MPEQGIDDKRHVLVAPLGSETSGALPLGKPVERYPNRLRRRVDIAGTWRDYRGQFRKRLFQFGSGVGFARRSCVGRGTAATLR